MAWLEVAPSAGEGTIWSLTVLSGEIYGGTSPNGKLYKWNGSDAWVEVAGKLGAETDIWSLAVYGGKIYGGTAPNGKLYEFNGVDAWVEVAPKFLLETYIYSLAVYDGKLYGGTYPNGKLLEWNDVDAWTEVAPKLSAEDTITALAEYDSKLYGGTGTLANLYEWNDSDAWSQKASRPGSEQYILALAEHDGALFGGSYPSAKLYQWNDVDAWVEKAGTPSGQTHITKLVSHDGYLYGSSVGDGKLFRWNGTDAWIEVCAKSGAETGVRSLTILDGAIYGGTAPNGKLLKYQEATNGASESLEISDAWHHISHIKKNSESLIISDVFSSSREYSAQTTESLTISDTWGSSLEKIAGVTESLTIDDSWTYFNWSKFLRQYQHLANRRFLCTISPNAYGISQWGLVPLDLPISSFQARGSWRADNYVSVTTPRFDLLPLLNQYVTLDPAGSKQTAIITVRLAYFYNGVEIHSETSSLWRSKFAVLEQSLDPNKRELKLSGYGQPSFGGATFLADDEVVRYSKEDRVVLTLSDFYNSFNYQIELSQANPFITIGTTITYDSIVFGRVREAMCSVTTSREQMTLTFKMVANP